jgi:hypothetical protein
MFVFTIKCTLTSMKYEILKRKDFQNMCHSKWELKYTFPLLLNVIDISFNLSRAERSFRTDTGNILRQVCRGECQNSADQTFDIELDVLVVPATHKTLHRTLYKPCLFHNPSMQFGDVVFASTSHSNY